MSCHFFGMKMCLESYQHLAAPVRLVGKFDTYGFHTVKYLHHSTWKGINGIMNCMAHTMWSLDMSKCKEVLKKSTYSYNFIGSKDYIFWKQPPKSLQVTYADDMIYISWSTK